MKKILIFLVVLFTGFTASAETVNLYVNFYIQTCNLSTPDAPCYSTMKPGKTISVSLREVDDSLGGKYWEGSWFELITTNADSPTFYSGIDVTMGKGNHLGLYSLRLNSGPFLSINRATSFLYPRNIADFDAIRLVGTSEIQGVFEYTPYLFVSSVAH